jgi:hypothetical protein
MTQPIETSTPLKIHFVPQMIPLTWAARLVMLVAENSPISIIITEVSGPVRMDQRLTIIINSVTITPVTTRRVLPDIGKATKGWTEQVNLTSASRFRTRTLIECLAMIIIPVSRPVTTLSSCPAVHSPRPQYPFPRWLSRFRACQATTERDPASAAIT